MINQKILQDELVSDVSCPILNKCKHKCKVVVQGIKKGPYKKCRCAFQISTSGQQEIHSLLKNTEEIYI